MNWIDVWGDDIVHNKKIYITVITLFFISALVTFFLYEYEMYLINSGKNFMSVNETINLYKKKKNINENVDDLIELARLYSVNKEYEKSKEYLLKALEKEPKNTIALHRLALVYENLNDFNKAIETRQKLVDIEPQKPENHYYYAILLLTKDINVSINEIELAVKYADESDKQFYMEMLELFKNSSKFIDEEKYDGYIDIINSKFLESNNNVKLEIIKNIRSKYRNLKIEDINKLENLEKEIKNNKIN
ncbi:MAG: Anaphase-promoting complex, cyclosome, subunit 3 [Caloramator sp.]|nr:Anaphase-promoting complex, cyclosome, subunit 3 [Caloramator sp.]